MAPAQREPSLTGPGCFHLLGEAGTLDKIGWDGPSRSKLWRYNQHYFDDLTARGAPERSNWQTALVADWIAGNPPAQGTGWEPYPTSLRIVNWIKQALNRAEPPHPEAVQSLAVQARWLTRRLEWHLLGNHLFANAKALAFAGLYFSGTEADRWLARAVTILRRELERQFLDDGAQFELSPMYHALGLEDLLDLLNLSRAYPGSHLTTLAPELEQRATAAQNWLTAMCHPDGEIALFNDAAIGVAPDPRELFAYAGRLGLSPPKLPAALEYFSASGYARLQAGDAVVFVDLAAIGPDYLPGHAHADTLSVEMSLGGQRVLVNSGTSEYGTGPERQRQRGTAAHNTVIVAGENSSEVWSGFRVGRRARPRDVMAAEVAGCLHVAGAHDGYRHLAGAPMVHRHVQVDARTMRITDRVTPVRPAEARFHIHPDVTPALTGTHEALLELPTGRRVRVRAETGTFRLESATWHPRFGQCLNTFCLVLPLAAGKASLIFTWI